MKKPPIRIDVQEIQSANSIEATCFVKGEKMGIIYLDYHNDKKDGSDTDEWVISFKPLDTGEDPDDIDPDILAQGNI